MHRSTAGGKPPLVHLETPPGAWPHSAWLTCLMQYTWCTFFCTCLLKFVFWVLRTLKPGPSQIPVATLRRVLVLSIRPLAAARAPGALGASLVVQVVLTMYPGKYYRSATAERSFFALGSRFTTLKDEASHNDNWMKRPLTPCPPPLVHTAVAAFDSELVRAQSYRPVRC